MADRTNNGRFTAGNRAASVRKAKSAPGSDGVVSYSGFLYTGERNPNLVGARKWVTYANAITRPPVAIAWLLRSALLAGVKWTLVENEAGGKDAQRGVEIVKQGLLDARLSKPWNKIAAKAGNGSFFNGFSLHAHAMGRRKDGMVVFTDIGHRPPHTVWRWLRASDTAPFTDVEQLIPGSGQHYPVSLSECLYMVNDEVGDSPEGVGVLRMVVDRIRKVEDEEGLELDEMFSSMGGTPVVRVPLEEIAAHAPQDPTARATYLAAATQGILDFVKNRIKTPERRQYIELDSATYQGSDPNTISTVNKWGIEILKGDLQGLADIRKSITDEDLNIARMLGVEFVFIGGGSSSGTYGMHESKVGLFAAALETTNADVAVAARDQLARRLIAANGLDPDTATPTLVPEPITAGHVLETAQALALIGGLPPKDPARDIMRQRMQLPPEPDDIVGELMAPRGPPRGPTGTGTPAAPAVPGENAPDPGAAPDVAGEQKRRR